MKIALKAPNGLYVSAEEGGGIDTRNPDTPVALRANRAEILEWETFEQFALAGEVYCALRTAGGYYVTAEQGGGSTVRTNATAIGPWERFIDAGGVFLCWDGSHYLTVEPGADPIVSARTLTPKFEIVTLEPDPEPPSLIAPVLHDWRGAFCIPAALPGSPYGDGSRIWTPAYGCYDDVWRTAIRTAYRARGYTHFVYNCAGPPYRDHYPELADDPTRVQRDLEELRLDGLLPVVCATDDRYPDTVLHSFAVNGAHIPICFPEWEMNDPLGNDEDRQKRLIDAVRAAAPTGACYLHFTPGHGSISYRSEMDGWRWCQDHGTTGLLAQGSNRFAEEDPKTGGEGLESTAVRLAGLTDHGAPPAWAGLHQLTVKFEYGIMDMYAGHVSEDQTRVYTEAFLRAAPHVAGFCDGGPAKVTR